MSETVIRLVLVCSLIFLKLPVSGQAPEISYGSYKFLLIDSTVRPLVHNNMGGPIPGKRYSETTTFFPNPADSLKRSLTLTQPSAIAVGKDGTLYISDEGDNSIKKISPGGVLTLIARGLNGPAGLAVSREGDIYVADAFSHQIKKISASGVVTVFAGTGRPGDVDSKNPRLSQFRYPVSICIDGAGNIYISDEGNHKIRKITPEGEVSTLAGTGRPGNTDNEDGKAASFNQPAGIAVDADGNLYLADQLNHKIRKITAGGTVSTLAGTGFAGSANDPDPLKASFNNPRDVGVGAAGWIYVCDTGNQLIRRISYGGEVSTLGGSGAAGDANSADGINASFYFPAGLAETDSGLYIADRLNSRIRKINTTGYVLTPSELPVGLNFDYLTGTISGRPTEFNPGATYQITAYNLIGSSLSELTISVSGQPGNAIKFDGVDDQVIMQNNPILTPDIVTAELWVKVGNSLPNHRFILKRNTLPHFDESYSLGVNPAGQFELLMSSGTGLVGSQVRIHHKVMPVPNRWYFVAGIFTSKDARLFVDGTLVAEGKSGFPVAKSNNALFLNFDERSQMTVDEVRIFDHDRTEKLKEDRVAPLPPETAGLIAYYDFNMGIPGGRNTYTTLFDKSPNDIRGEMHHFYPAPGLISNWVESFAMIIPARVWVSDLARDGFTLHWQSPRFGKADHYLLDIATDRMFHNIVPDLQNKPVNGTSFKVTGLKPLSTYFARVRAYKASTAEEGGDSEIVEVITSD